MTASHHSAILPTPQPPPPSCRTCWNRSSDAGRARKKRRVCTAGCRPQVSRMAARRSAPAELESTPTNRRTGSGEETAPSTGAEPCWTAWRWCISSWRREAFAAASRSRNTGSLLAARRQRSDTEASQDTNSGSNTCDQQAQRATVKDAAPEQQGVPATRPKDRAPHAGLLPSATQSLQDWSEGKSKILATWPQFRAVRPFCCVGAPSASNQATVSQHTRSQACDTGIPTGARGPQGAPNSEFEQHVN